MGCPTEVVIGDDLTFSICTHDPDTGVLTDADAVPSYRVYEDETEAAILSGSVDDGTGAADQFDDANTTGFYAKTISCTSGNGFENGKTYTIYIEATVDSDTGGISYGFKAVSAAGSLTVSPIAGTIASRFTSPLLTLVQHEDIDYGPWVITDTDGNPVDLSGLALALVVYDLEGDADEEWRLTTGDSEITVGGVDNNQVTLTDDDTHTGTACRWGYTLWDTDNGAPIQRGILAIERSAGPTAPV